LSEISQTARAWVDSALNEPYCRFLGVRAAEIESGKVRFELPYRDEISNPGRQVHGGVMCSMLGIAGRAAALSQTELTAPFCAASAEINVTYLSSAVGEGMVAHGEVMRRGKELTHVRCTLTTEAAKPLGSAMVIFRVVPGAESPPAALTIEHGAPPQTEFPSIARALSGAPFISALGIRVNRFQGGRAELAMPFRADICGGDGALHEGALGALVDTAGALSAWSTVRPKPGMKVSTVSIDVNFCSSIKDAGVVAHAHVVTRRNELFFNRVDVVSPEGVPIALGNVIYRIVLPE
jgi:uncharacterized protein (TIGR00369 family)